MKYRIFHKEFNKYVGSEEYFLGFDGKVYFEEIEKEVNKINLVECTDKVILQENTGFKDRNEKPIFDGDSVKDSDGVLGKVFWSENSIAVGNDTANGCLNLVGWSVLFDTLKEYAILLSNESGESSSKSLEIVSSLK